jgi:hypothetical protein
MQNLLVHEAQTLINMLGHWRAEQTLLLRQMPRRSVFAAHACEVIGLNCAAKFRTKVLPSNAQINGGWADFVD